MNTVIDLEKEIVRENTATLLAEEKTMDAQRKLDHEAAKVEARVSAAYRDGIMSELGFDYTLAEARALRKERKQFGALPTNRIMSIEAIKATCIKYGLRFLPTRFYKGALDEGIGPAVEQVRELLGGSLVKVKEPEAMQGFAAPIEDKVQFYIAAPSSAFALQPRPQDPLLFLRLNAIKFYLVHKWGDNLRTGDVRKGEIGTNNWNSLFADQNRSSMTGAQIWNAMNSDSLASSNAWTSAVSFTTSSPSQWMTTASIANLFNGGTTP